MTIKTKLALIISCFAMIILSLNIVLSYFSTRDNLRRDREANMMLTAKHIALAVEQSRSMYNYVKMSLGNKMSSGMVDGILYMTSPERIVRESLGTNQSLLEISGFNPEQINQDHLLFGTYEYKNDDMVERAVRETISQKKSLLYDTVINNKHVLVSYVPILPNKQAPYVIRIISSYEPIANAISRQVIGQFTVSFSLLLLMILASYWMAGRLIQPLRNILDQVNELSVGQFEARLQVDRKDELGLLANKINAMADSLGNYTRELTQKNEENRSMKEYLESIISQTADAIHITDIEGRVLLVNPAFESLYGWKSEEIIGSHLDFIPPFEEEDNRLAWRQEEEAYGKTVSVVTETVRLRKDGSCVEVGISVSPIYDQEGKITAFISISRDMTEHNKMDELLRRSEKLTTVGQLAAGVAHEIRNPLTTLRGFLQMQQQTKTINTMHTDVMLAELDRINLIVSEFLILAKPQAVQFQTKDVRFTVGDVVSLLDSEAHLHNIEFEVLFSQQPVFVHCEENQLKQVFINVLKNAMEAMPKGGKIALQLEAGQGGQAVLRVIDEGEGIAKERLHKLGEPFYTNKEKGTGLGLMVSQRIIESHRGTMLIESELGKGTVVTITLPLASAEEAADSGEMTDLAD
ncbi:MAG: PAS domain S-box protein [Paenibacillus macerans]|uniref:histidine kinase n=2 Tax=Paenibacillus macerans TaxID=44252 RepID=A0A6N8F2R7_PAEMA|nr:ATP-binding protein [Paenibacillus macerans]MBS5913940.1 PAS domain S-box protein [Paenibacillus macerans]MCY7559258.1 PAS domain S-box protein [Paenibacillus macerans]MDU7476225.1 PAS domain S-box protein [Paenibacillus macerans]MEC0137240.1 PAS domain S-box protein [Paenibacillus macerans]MEC0154872.1 PAS domain S-box protein [Paenibacillus macerans]